MSIPTEPGYYWRRDIDPGCSEAFQWEPHKVFRHIDDRDILVSESPDGTRNLPVSKFEDCEWGPRISDPDEDFNDNTSIDDLNDQLEAAVAHQQREELRDTFAAMAVSGLLSHRGVVCPTHPPGEVSSLAADAYAIADAMLAERDKNA